MMKSDFPLQQIRNPDLHTGKDASAVFSPPARESQAKKNN